MDRTLSPVFLQARTALEVILDQARYRLASESHHPDAFGSAEVEYRGRHERVRLTWDGKDRWVGLWVAKIASPNQHPRSTDWRTLEPDEDTAGQFLSPGSLTDARISALVW